MATAQTRKVRMPDNSIREVEDTPEAKAALKQEIAQMKAPSKPVALKKLKMPDGSVREVEDTPEAKAALKVEMEQMRGTVPFAPKPAKVSQPEDEVGAIEGAFNDVKNFFLPKTEGIDYASGVQNPWLREEYFKQETDEERAAVLNKALGEGNWGKDEAGAPVITTQAGADRASTKLNKVEFQGNPIALDEHRLTLSDVADLRGDATSILGGMIGPALAVAKGPAGMVQAAVGGTVAGKAWQELNESIEGTNLQRPMQILSTIADEGAWAALGEGGTQVLSGIARKVLAPQLARLTPIRREALEYANKIGLKLHSAQITDAPLVGYAEAVWRRAFGGNNAAHNAEVLESSLEALRNQSGPQESLELVGKSLVKKVQTRTQAFNTLLGRQLETARSIVKNSVSDFSEKLGKANLEVGDDIVNNLQKSYGDFNQAATNAYKVLDEHLEALPTQMGNLQLSTKLYPTAKLKERAADMLRSVVRNEKGEIVLGSERAYADSLQRILDLGDYESLVTAQNLRTNFRELAYSPDMLGSGPLRNARQLVKAIDDGFDEVVSTAKPMLAKQIREVRAEYTKGVQAFDNAFITRITRDPSKAGAIDGSLISDAIARQPARAKQLRSALSRTPEGRELFDSAVRDNFDKAVESVKTVDGLIDGKKFAAKLLGGSAAQKAAMRDIYGDNYVEIARLARGLKAVDGEFKIPAKALEDGTLKEAVRKAAATKAKYEAFTEQDWVKQLSKPGVEFIQAADTIFKKGNNRQLVKTAKEFYGAESETFKKLQRVSMMKLLNGVIDTAKDSPFSHVLNGHKLKKNIAEYGVEAAEEMFGKELTADVIKFAEIANVATREPAKGAGAIAVAAMMMRPLKYPGELLKLFGLSKLFTSRWGLNYMTEGLLSTTKGGWASAGTNQAIRSTAENAVRFNALMQLIPEEENGDLMQYVGATPPKKPPPRPPYK